MAVPLKLATVDNSHAQMTLDEPIFALDFLKCRME